MTDIMERLIDEAKKPWPENADDAYLVGWAVAYAKPILAHIAAQDARMEAAAQTIATLRADLAKAVEGLHGYKAAVAFISADSWDGCSDCINILKAARCADMMEPLTLDETAAHLKRIRKHYEPSLIKELRP